ncbi:hypothetical protein GOB83_02630 [Acetobacter fabarum]|uniref:Uncharacterized protein n=1 Tax=Acetobacter fabarum TaxID=483199 RepID=A0A269Y282_9PROT|nr:MULTISPECIES: hypothetical protein [Acetobacter]MDN6714010.1 hypothetical protein [Acetobacter sp.]MCH4027161.1 hypothetical protein [Acetobacter fabarum]MCH4055350.1 hypothetical protein [Acetobacter fabarum]MCH4084977.1 hypothetical protein [Acetobacter fabarum]MCH4127817.1 hypothetical protein [Acetobacter fabarum]
MIPDTGKLGAARRIVQGMLQLAAGKREGLACFEGTPDAFGAALAPQMACILVGGIQIFLLPDKVMSATKLLLSFCVLLLPAVISQFYAQRWGRGALWLRYITAATWCGWVVVLISLACAVIAAVITPDIARQQVFIGALALCAAAYELWLQWFVAKVGLGISGGRAALLYVSILVASATLYGLAALLPPHYMVIHDLLQPMVNVKAK